MSKHISKLFSDYDRAWSKLVQQRDIEFPVGTRVRCRLSGITGTVKEGSLYADQVNTTAGHMGWRRLEKINESGGV